MEEEADESVDIVDTDNEEEEDDDDDEAEVESILETEVEVPRSRSIMSQSVRGSSSKNVFGGRNGLQVVDLTSFMEKMDIANHGRNTTKKEKFSSSKPFFCYKWKDDKLNQFVTLEILLQCCGETCTVEIQEISGGKQLLVLSQPLPQSWLDMDFFRDNVDKLVDDDDDEQGYPSSRKQIEIKAFNRSQRLAARADYLKTMSNKFGENAKEDCVIIKQYFKLPFRCDDVNVSGGYPGTGYHEQMWPVLGSKRVVMRGGRYVEEREEIGSVNVLTIHLVAEEKYQKRNDKTPRRKKIAAAYSSSGNNDDDRIYFDMSSVNRGGNRGGQHRGGGGAGLGSAGLGSAGLGVGAAGLGATPFHFNPHGRGVASASASGGVGVGSTGFSRRAGGLSGRRRSRSRGVRGQSLGGGSAMSVGTEPMNSDDAMSYADGNDQSYNFATPRGGEGGEHTFAIGGVNGEDDDDL